ncbi:hypothetical protein [Hymenobacter cellulosivorans]|uniref:Outer membrane protein beta-barrel domain-containing protein n=1 Tax=Hymenobacter cellulosivorans TaxID=2932249 RepID=A0ABY4FIB7_9BACT|nr:hypothetical protein [Hymenobacter cellulosivorans]UOQ54206.1 hypothetical protein MUN80_05450 [Hymenobacter cellulosivorans]
MKKLFLLGLLAFSAEAIQAQSIAAGTLSLGGNVGYNRTERTNSASINGRATSVETTSSEFGISPSIGYFLADNLAIGLSVGYSAYREPYSTYSPAPGVVRAELDPTTTLSVGPFVQYYKMISEQFGVVGTLNGGFQSQKSYDYTNNSPQPLISEFKAKGLYAGLTPSIVFFPIPKLGLSASIGGLQYDRLSYDYPTNAGTAPPDYENKTSNLGAYFGLDQLQFGGTFYFGR